MSTKMGGTLALVYECVVRERKMKLPYGASLWAASLDISTERASRDCSVGRKIFRIRNKKITNKKICVIR